MITHKTQFSQGIDWLQITSSKILYPDTWDNYYTEAGHGRFGYTRMKTWRDGRVLLSNPDRPEMGYHHQLTASTLARLYSDYAVSPWDVLGMLGEYDRLTRIDVCVDVLRGSLHFNNLEKAIEHKHVKTRAKTSDRFHAIGGEGDTIYVGDTSSPKRMRIYNKAAEQRIEGMEWTRVELQVRKPYADEVRKAIMSAPGDESVIPGLITGFADFQDDSDWRKVFKCAPILMKSPESEKSSTTDWLLKVVAPSLARHQFKNPQFPILDDFMTAYRAEYEKLHHNLP